MRLLLQPSKRTVEKIYRCCCDVSMRAFVQVCVRTYLDEANVGALLAEALTADVEAVLADQTSGVGADAAVEVMSASVASHIPSSCAFVFSPSTAHCCLARPHATHAMPESSPHRYRKDV